jgi:uncharacterized membrane protein
VVAAKDAQGRIKLNQLINTTLNIRVLPFWYAALDDTRLA